MAFIKYVAPRKLAASMKVQVDLDSDERRTRTTCCQHPAGCALHAIRTTSGVHIPPTPNLGAVPARRFSRDLNPHSFTSRWMRPLVRRSSSSEVSAAMRRFHSGIALDHSAVHPVGELPI